MPDSNKTSQNSIMTDFLFNFKLNSTPKIKQYDVSTCTNIVHALYYISYKSNIVQYIIYCVFIVI